MKLRRLARSFTLLELVLYLGLISVGFAMFATIEVNAQRSVALQQAMIDVQLTSQDYLSEWRRDVEDSAKLELSPERLVIVRRDGHRVTYTAQERQESDAAGALVQSRPFPRATKVTFTRPSPTGPLQAELTVSVRFGWRDTLE
ncbi:MAG TPA: hypothetical protein DEA08_11745, partial [Planctomycetes bacterium]|nr:hypothetical protein [Planctomycetota bacterium]